MVSNSINLTPVPAFFCDLNKRIIYTNTLFAENIKNPLDINKQITLDMLNFYSTVDSQNKVDLLSCGSLKQDGRINRTLYLTDQNGNKELVLIAIKYFTKEQSGFGIEGYSIIIVPISDQISCANNIIDDQNGHNLTFRDFTIIGKDKKMLELFNMIKLAGESMANIFISGESGTGKELIARAIHLLSERNKQPFITVNCSSLPDNLLESELFGFVKGAFTGAIHDKTGLFEAAKGGTIFLDEIGDISPLIQVKLLRVIQEKTITRIGENIERALDIRIITATNRNLKELVSSGNFREDLYYRLKVFPIYSIPLRERMIDIPHLCEYFIHKYNIETGKKIKGVSDDGFRIIMDYSWPGNVRELQNAIEHAFVLCSGDLIDMFDLPQEIRAAHYKDFNTVTKPSDKIFDNKEIKPFNKNNKEELIDLLNRFKWNRTELANHLGISRVSLWKKIKSLGIKEN